MNKIAEQQTSDDKNSTKVKSEESTKKNGNNDVKKPEQVEFVTPRRYENPPSPARQASQDPHENEFVHPRITWGENYPTHR